MFDAVGLEPNRTVVEPPRIDSEPPPPANASPSLEDALEALRLRKLIPARMIAAALTSPGDRWTTRRARRWLRKSGAGFQMNPPKGQWFTTRERLRDRFPDVLEQILLVVPEEDLDALDSL